MRGHGTMICQPCATQVVVARIVLIHAAHESNSGLIPLSRCLLVCVITNAYGATSSNGTLQPLCMATTTIHATITTHNTIDSSL